MTTPNKESWEEKFDSKFPQELVRKSINWGMEDDPRSDLKSFISSLIKETEERVVREILGLNKGIRRLIAPSEIVDYAESKDIKL
jgi:hypothetical protein